CPAYAASIVSQPSAVVRSTLTICRIWNSTPSSGSPAGLLSVLSSSWTCLYRVREPVSSPSMLPDSALPPVPAIAAVPATPTMARDRAPAPAARRRSDVLLVLIFFPFGWYQH